MSPTPGRALLIAAYALFAAAGGSGLLAPSPAVAATSRGIWAIAWAGLFLIGGAASLAGMLRNHWLGEWCGLPPLVAVWLVYGISASVILLKTGDMSRLPGSLALLAVAAYLASRWRVVALERLAARQVRQHQVDEAG